MTRLDDIDMAMLMEEIDSESGSQKGLQGINIENPAHEKEGTMATRERPGTPRALKLIVADVVPQANHFYNKSNC